MTDYEIYVERYSKARQISKEAAEAHKMVKGVKAFYENTFRDAVNREDPDENGYQSVTDSREG